MAALVAGSALTVSVLGQPPALRGGVVGRGIVSAPATATPVAPPPRRHRRQPAAHVPTPAPATLGVFSLTPPSQGVPATVLGNPSVDGVALRPLWSDLETGDGQYTWSFLDSQVAAIVKANKAVTVSVMAGDATPAWVFAAGAQSFSTIVANPAASDFCHTIQIPIPWDPVFLAKWTAFIKAMGAHYATTGIARVHITGINDRTEETTLPSQTGEVVNGCTTNDDVSEWQSVGYSGALIKGAWTQISDAFALAFPGSQIVPMILPSSFPPIDDAGHLNPAWTNLQDDLVQISIAGHPSQFGVQNNGLSDFFIMPSIVSLASSTPTAHQTLWFATNDPTCRLRGTAPCDAHAELQTAVNMAFEAGADSLELYQTDIGNPALADIVAAAHNRMRNQAFQFTAANWSVAEGTQALITVERTRGTTGTVSVQYATSDGTAMAGTEYQSASGTLTFGPGVVSRTFLVPTMSDTLHQPDETVLLNLTNPSSGTVLGTQSTAVLVIADHNVPGTLQFSASGYTVGEGGAATITVTRVGGVASGVSVAYATAGGTAVPGANYVPAAGVLSFGAGTTSQQFTVQTLQTGVVQANLTVGVSLSSPSGGASLGAVSSAALTILEDNPVFEFGAPGYTVSESSPTAVITVMRSGSTAGTASVSYSTADGTAKDGVNYTHASGTLTFGPGATQKTFSVPIINDTQYQPTLTVLLGLSNPSTGAALGAQSAAVLSITDDDLAGTLSLSAGSYTTSETAGTATITVNRTGGAASGVTVFYTTVDGTAVAGVDYLRAFGTLTFPAGVSSQAFPVKILNDGTLHPDRSLGIALHKPSAGATLGTPSVGTLTIQSDDPVVEFSAASYTIAEKGGAATITVNRSRKTTLPVSVAFKTSDGTATAPGDYTAASGTLNFAAGVTAQTFTVPVSDDALVEGTETVNLTLLNAGGGAVLGAQQTAVLSIAPDDAVLQFSAPSYAVSEAAPVATITISRAANTATTASVAYATVAGGSAIEGQHYLSTAGTLTFPPGVVAATFAVPILDDLVHQSPRTVNLALSNPSGGLLGTPSTAVLTINDVDQPGVLQFTSGTFSVSEGALAAAVTVTRSGGMTSDALVTYATSDGTASAGVNYVATSGTLQIVAGQTSATFLVPIIDDQVKNGNQTVNLVLSNPTGGNTLGAQSTATLWIVENR
jgi:hypothetical protein